MNTLAPGATAFNPNQYSTVVSQLQLPKEAFETCLNTQKFEARVHADYANALASGGTGSPYIILHGHEPQIFAC